MSREQGQYCPVTLGSEVLSDRWTLMILREMVLGSTRFNDIERGLPGISRALLAQRLKHLERKGVLERRPARAGRGSEYHLTPAGRALEPIIMAIGEWAIQWMFTEPEPAQADPVALMWRMHRMIDGTSLPDRRVVVEFDFVGQQAKVLWLVLDRGDPSVCAMHPGFDSDVIVTTEAMALLRVFHGFDSLGGARRTGAIVIDGPPALTRSFERWFGLSPLAPAMRAAVAARG